MIAQSSSVPEKLRSAAVQVNQASQWGQVEQAGGDSRTAWQASPAG
jgi:hypothetical protein